MEGGVENGVLGARLLGVVLSVYVMKFSSFILDIDMVFSSTVDTESLLDSGNIITNNSVTKNFPKKMIGFILISSIVFGKFDLNIEEGI
jgi:zinc transporter ZupT